LSDVPVTWDDVPQSPWSQHQEPVEHPDPVQQNNVIVPNIVEPVHIPHLYTPQGVGLYFNFVIYIYFIFIVSYKSAGQLPILWEQVQESLLSGMLPSEVYQQLGADFYFAFRVDIRAAHYNYMKQVYGFTDEQLSRSHQLDDSFIL
jgi:hypothetical protein